MRLDYPKDIGLDAEFQDKYGLLRRVRPVVPAPTKTPMPDRIQLFADDKSKQRDQQCRLYSVYMRPWTLVSAYHCELCLCCTDWTRCQI